jgi:hypothetical protein
MEDQSHIDLVETYFDANARSWSDFYEARGGRTDFVLADRRDMALDFLAECAPEGGHVLDAGCGAGPVARPRQPGLQRPWCGHLPGDGGPLLGKLRRERH